MHYQYDKSRPGNITTILFRTSIIKEANDNNHDMWHVWEKRIGEYKVLAGKPKGEKDHLEELALDGG